MREDMSFASNQCRQSAGTGRWLVFALALLVAGCQATGSDMSKIKPAQNGDKKKTSSGRSFMEQTTVAAAPAPAAPPSGSTWLPDQFLVITGKSQYDPQIEVATTGHVFAVWLDAFTPGVTFTKSIDRGAT
jgi:hypothetical protein